MESAADLLNMQVRTVRPPWFLAFSHVKKAAMLVLITMEFFLKGFSMKIGFSSKRREMFFFFFPLTTNMVAVTSRANQQWPDRL